MKAARSPKYYNEATGLLGGVRDEEVRLAPFEVRRGFVRQVFGLLSLQVTGALTIAVWLYWGGSDVDWLKSKEWILWVSTFATITLLVAMACCGPTLRRSPNDLACLCLLSVSQGFMAGCASAIFGWQSLILAAAMQAWTAAGLMSFAFTARTDLTGLMPFGALFLIVATAYAFAVLVLPGLFNLSVDGRVALYDALCVLIFSAYALFDLQLMLGKWGGHPLFFAVRDTAFATLSFYTDIVQFVFFVMNVTGERY